MLFRSPQNTQPREMDETTTVFIWLACVAPASCLVHFTGLGILWIYGFCQATEILKTFLGILLIKKGRWIQNVVDHA